MLFEQLHLPEPSMWHFLLNFFFINYIEYNIYKHHRTARPHSHVQRESALF